MLWFAVQIGTTLFVANLSLPNLLFAITMLSTSLWEGFSFCSPQCWRNDIYKSADNKLISIAIVTNYVAKYTLTCDSGDAGNVTK